MHQVQAPQDLPDLNDDLRQRIDLAPHLPDKLRDFALLSLWISRTAIVSVMATFTSAISRAHGRRHSLSIGEMRHGVIRLLTWLGETFCGVSAIFPPRRTSPCELPAPVGRRLLADRYLVTYRRRHPVDPEDLERWKVVWAAARLLEPIPAEHPKLIRFLEQ